MAELTKKVEGRFSIYFVEETIDPPTLINLFRAAPAIEGKGRGGIGILKAGPFTLACRKYVHGGLFRVFTGDLFLTGGRALSEIETTCLLREGGFPVVKPFCAVVEDRLLTKRLYLLTLFEEDAEDLLQFLARSGAMTRLRTIRNLAVRLYQMERLGVYHPDLHLNNVLIGKDGDMLFLDFDKGRRGRLSKKDMARMFFRLNRFAEKMERSGAVTFTLKEKAFFLRTYRRVSGYDILSAMEGRVKAKSLSSRMGWFVERMLYGPDKRGKTS
jgi:hypothetical protein